MFGINGGEFVVLLVVALVVVGPERLPRYAAQLGVWAREVRRYAFAARERVSDELGEDIKDVDWAALDPRRYDPRRIVREAFLDDAAVEPRAMRATGAGASGAIGAAGPSRRGSPAAGGAPRAVRDVPAGVSAPFDDEAT